MVAHPSTTAIYCILVLMAVTPAASQTLHGTVADAETGQPIVGGRVMLLDSLSSVNGSDETGEGGRFSVPAKVGSTYSLKLEALGYDGFISPPSPLLPAIPQNSP